VNVKKGKRDVKEKLPRHHEDAVVIGPMSKDTSCVFAFGPDAHYEAIVKPSLDGCTLIRRMPEEEAEAWRLMPNEKQRKVSK